MIRSVSAMLAGVVMAIGIGNPAWASGVIWFWNMTDAYVTVNVDGVFGCNTSAGSQCTIPVADGDHIGRAQTAYGVINREILIDNNTIRWCIYTTDDPASEARCIAWRNGQ